MPASQGPSWNRLRTAIVGLGCLSLLTFVTETGLGREVIRWLTTSSVSEAVTGVSQLVLLAVWGGILVTGLFVLDTAIGYAFE